MPPSRVAFVCKHSLKKTWFFFSLCFVSYNWLVQLKLQNDILISFLKSHDFSTWPCISSKSLHKWTKKLLWIRTYLKTQIWRKKISFVNIMLFLSLLKVRQVWVSQKHDMQVKFLFKYMGFQIKESNVDITEHHVSCPTCNSLSCFYLYYKLHCY